MQGVPHVLQIPAAVINRTHDVAVQLHQAGRQSLDQGLQVNRDTTVGRGCALTLTADPSDLSLWPVRLINDHFAFFASC